MNDAEKPATIHVHVNKFVTRTLTIVVQKVVNEGEAARPAMAAALREYADDLDKGHAGNGVFERHVNAGCRIEAIASIPAFEGSEAREDVVDHTALGALVERVQHARDLAGFLAGGESDNEIGAALGYTREQAADALRSKLDETLAALPG